MNHFTNKPYLPSDPDAFKAIFEYATLSILLVDINGIIRLSNPHLDNLFGYESGDLTGQKVEVLIPEDYQLNHGLEIKEYFDIPQRKQMVESREVSARKKNGEVFPIEISLGYYDASPHPMAIVFLSDITHRKKTEQTLYEDEKRLKDIIQSISDAFMGFTSDWQYHYVNEKALTILGKTRQEVLGKTIWEVFPNALGENFEREFQRRQNTDFTPFTLRTQQGSTWWEVRVTIYNNGMALLCSDITEAVFALEAQHQSEEQFSVIFNSSPAAISITELDSGIIHDINQTYCLLLGCSKAELAGKTMVEAGIIKSTGIRINIINSIRKNGTLRNFELVVFNKKEIPIYLLASADIIRLADQDYLLVAGSDISTTKTNTEELKRSEEKFAKTFRQSPVALSITRVKDGRLIEVNNSFLELLGYRLEEVIGRTSEELKMYPNTKERDKTMAELSERGYIRNKELVCHTKTNTPVHVIFSMEMIELRGEACVITTALNITDKKKAEEAINSYTGLLEQKVTERTLELTQALEREKEVSDLKSRFVSIASHEFRTPLSTILSSTYLLEQMKDAEDKTKHYNRIRSAVKNLTFILTEFLSLDKLEQRKVTVENELFDLDTLTSEVIDEVRIAYRLSLPIDYIHSGSRLLLQDKRIIRNVLLNVISNAAKYSPTNKTIKLRSIVNEHRLIIQVADEGIGIPLEDQKFIFTKFFRAHNANHIQGTGLGLSITKRYVELLDGTINFRSSPEEGTEFEIILPLQKVTLEKA